MSRPRRRRTSEIPPPDANWLTTYGDLVTLLMCFFVLLYSFSTLETGKFRQVALSIQAALTGVLDGGASLNDKDLLNKGGELTIDEAYAVIDAYLEEAGLRGRVEAVYDERGLAVRFLDTVLFDLAKADLRPEALGILDRVAEVLQRVPNQIAVEGHTDNLPINTREFPSNWWLSTARANRVVEYLIHKHKLTPERLSAVGYGEYRPLVPNSSAANRARNRRVEILIKRTSVGALEPR